MLWHGPCQTLNITLYVSTAASVDSAIVVSDHLERKIKIHHAICIGPKIKN
jgi:hypothetical protein